jgi:hypothetical protein
MLVFFRGRCLETGILATIVWSLRIGQHRAPLCSCSHDVTLDTFCLLRELYALLIH